MIITIDGPAGSGKSTAARNLANALDISYLDTGATYRVATLAGLQAGLDMNDADALRDRAESMDLKLIPHDDQPTVLLDGKDVSEIIRTPEVTDSVHYIANAPTVREVLVNLQRQLGAELGSFVSEGRDQGSAVFPDADFKFYLDASPEQRATRRLAEYESKGQSAEFDTVLKAIVARDESDAGRAVGPLCVPENGIRIDTTHLNPQQVVEALKTLVETQA